MLRKILTESWDCKTPNRPGFGTKSQPFPKIWNGRRPYSYCQSSHDDIFSFCLIHCDCGRVNVYFFIFCVFVSCLCFYCLPKSSHADKSRLLSPAGCGSCGQLATAPTWSIASTPQCNEWNKTRCSDDDDDYDHLNILVYQSDPDPTQLINLNKTIWTQLRYLLLCSWKM